MEKWFRYWFNEFLPQTAGRAQLAVAASGRHLAGMGGGGLSGV